MKGPKLGAMAWRNLWRHRRRTMLTLSSIAFGTMLAVIFTGMGDAQWGDMIDLAARLGGGHVTLQHEEYLDTPSLSRTVRETGLRERALADPEVERVVTRITGQLMLSTADQSYGAAFIAFDPAAEDVGTLSLLEALAEGAIFDPGDSNGIVLGQRLAENLDLKLGRKVVYTLTDRSGEIVRDVARVSGILRTGSPTVDGALCLLPIDHMRRVLGYAPDEATLLALFVSDRRSSRSVSARLQPDVAGAAALTWRQVQPDLAGFIAMKIAGARIMEVVILILVAAGIFNTLFVSVMERVREFGIMMALGFSPSSLFALVMYESLWLGLVGLVGAAVVTAGPYGYLSTVGLDLTSQIELSGSEVAGIAISPILHVWIYPENLALIAAAVLLATLLAGVYPAWRAGRVAPAESIRLV